MVIDTIFVVKWQRRQRTEKTRKEKRKNSEKAIKKRNVNRKAARRALSSGRETRELHGSIPIFFDK